MDDMQRKVAIGAMLHDIGKVLYRSSDGRNHSRSGHDFLRDEIGIKDKDILDQVLYHHADLIRGSGIAEDSPAYITYMADNIASAADRRNLQNESKRAGFDKCIPLESVFNILNKNHSQMVYYPSTMDKDGLINYPMEEGVSFDSSFYSKIEQGVREALKGLVVRGQTDREKETGQGESGGYPCTEEGGASDSSYSTGVGVEYINSLVGCLEAYLTYVPSSTNLSERADISLYDHMKLTAALASCILLWLRENDIHDYRSELYTGAKAFYEKKVFYLYSMDVSGIQSFIYHQFGTDKVLKNLRARSFYLELMMENFVDTLLREEGLSRANLIYSGGGHAYLLLPNTREGREMAEAFAGKTNAWLQETFSIDLFLGTGGVACSANDLENNPEGSYGDLFRTVSRKISQSKVHRYTAGQIRILNQRTPREGSRECIVCHRSDLLLEDGRCRICSGLAKLSAEILDWNSRSKDDAKRNFYVIRKGQGQESRLPIYRDEYLEVADAAGVRGMLAKDSDVIAVYSKNDFYTGSDYATKMWVADYSSARTLGELVRNGEGISRLGVIRADVDDLGTAFVSGFPKEYQTLSRSATFSRTLSMFFKWHVNALLENGGYSLDDGGEDIIKTSSYGRTVSGADGSDMKKAMNGESSESANSGYAQQDSSTEIKRGSRWQKAGKNPRNATVIYAGGDDLFIVGAWKDIIEFAVDLHRSLREFSEGTLKISAGIGMFDEKYPISYIASQSGDLESASKSLEGKNAVTLFADKDHTYRWDEFIDEVLEEKYQLFHDFFSFAGEVSERGKAFLYNILELFRTAEKDRINLARLAYLLARLEPTKKSGNAEAEEYYRLYQEFKRKLYYWQRSEKDRRQAITAIYIYAYTIR